MPQVNCKVCMSEFYVKLSHQKLGYGKYCSRTCQHLAQRTGKSIKCHICGTESWKIQKAIKTSKSGYFFCGKSCQTKWRNSHFSGELHPNWKDGSQRNYREKMLKTTIERRCHLCGQADIRILAVHHKDKNRTNCEIDNLVWVCFNCHHLIHNHGLNI